MKSSTQHPKRHCMVVFAFYPWGETRVQRQAEALVEHGYEVDVLCLRTQNEPAFEVVRGVNVYRLPVRRVLLIPNIIGRFLAYLLFLILSGLKLIPLYLKQRYGVVQAHNLPDFLVFCTLFPKLLGAKAILDIHDVMPEFFAEEAGRSMDHWLVKLVTWQEQISCRFADHVITVTELWRRSLIERGVPDEKSSVVMNLADHNFFHDGISGHNHHPNGTFRLIYHGTQAERHGLDTLLYALDKVRSEVPNLCVVLHGRGAYHEELIKIVDKLDLSDRVKFSTTLMALKDLPAFIASHDAGVVPYHNDVFTGGILPTKLLEYTALNMPSIAACTPAIKDYFNETMVQFFEPGNVQDLAKSLVKLYRDEKLRQTLVKTSQRFNRQYNWSNESANYVKLIDRLNRS